MHLHLIMILFFIYADDIMYSHVYMPDYSSPARSLAAILY